MSWLSLQGSLKVVLRDEFGSIKRADHYKNMIVSLGRSFLAAWLAASSQSTKFMPYIGIGTDDTEPTDGDSELGAEFDTRKAGAISSENNLWQSTAAWAAGQGTGTIAEAGLFSADTDGTMFSHALIGPYVKGATDTLTITWTLEVLEGV
jgi:hypothetical protein